MPQLSGQITVETPGTAVQGPNVPGSSFILKAPSSNTGNVFVGGSNVDANGYILEPGDVTIIAMAAHGTEPNSLNDFWFDGANANDVVCWLRFG